MKAYERDVEVYKDRYGQEHAKSIMFNQTLNEFKNSTDSINRRMHNLLKQQDKKLKNLETALYHVTEVDTTLTKIINIPTMPDTTLDLSNEHITNIIKLSPTLVSSKVSLEDELIGSFDYKRETVKPPHKFFLFRWFQKRHTIVEADIMHTNPIIKNKSQRFIKIIE